MEKLTQQLDILIEKIENVTDFREQLKNLRSVFPFSEYEYIIVTLFSRGKLTFDEYLEIRDSYIDRNLYLYVFEISAPRGFGDTWAFGHLIQLVPEFERPSKKVDENYTGEYDLILRWNDKQEQHFIKIEVKASRAVDFERADAPLYVKALTSDSVRPFDMNFQQLKPKCCDVFLWVAVWRDSIKYWVLSSKEVSNNRFYSKGQHRGNVDEGQLHINQDNIENFKSFLTTSTGLKSAIIAAYKRQKNLK
jgi:hypothetical protein